MVAARSPNFSLLQSFKNVCFTPFTKLVQNLQSVIKKIIFFSTFGFGKKKISFPLISAKLSQQTRQMAKLSF